MALVIREKIKARQSTWSSKQREVIKMNTMKKIYNQLQKSAETGDLAQIKALIAANVDVNAKLK